MATVKGPLFSLDASGTVGGSVVFANWKGRNYVRRHVVPANPKSVDQVSVRAMLRFLSQIWKLGLSDGDKADWEDRAAVDNVSPFNAFCGYNLNRWGMYTGPTKLDPATETGTPGTYFSGSVEAQIKSGLFKFKLSVLNDNWGVLLHQSLTGAFTPARSNVVRCLLLDDTDEITFLITGLTTGTSYWFDFTTFTDDGVFDDPVGNFGPVVIL